MLIRNVEVADCLCDVRLEGNHIAAIGSLSGDADFDGGGRALLPGLHDHHIHLNALAAAMKSVRCGPPEVKAEAELIAALNRPGTGWLRGYGYHHSVAGEINRDWLDRHGPNRPVRIQHRSGRMWLLNSLAMQALDLTEPRDGRLLDNDRLTRKEQDFPDLRPLVERLLTWGITGVTEVTPSNSQAEFDNYLRQAAPLRLSVMGSSDLTDMRSPYRGHLKLHYHDHNLPPLEALTAEIKAAHDSSRPVAAHCVTRAELMLILAGIEAAGPMTGDRIEHAAIADQAAINWIERLGVIVVTQPNFIAERVEAYRRDVPERDHPHLWRLASFSHLPCAAGSDAPFGDPNPWAAMAAAVKRPKGFESEAISPEAVLALYTKPWDDAGGLPRQVAVGEVADLCLIDRSWKHAREDLGAVQVLASWIDGQLVFDGVDQAPS